MNEIYKVRNKLTWMTTEASLTGTFSPVFWSPWDQNRSTASEAINLSESDSD